MLYDRIIIGAGAAGLYCASCCRPPGRGLILEKTSSPGQKLLLTGSGQCNLTHGGSIKDFIGHYGPGGSKIRSALYKGNNLLLMKFFTERGLRLTQRPDGKVFPESMKASQVCELLIDQAKSNGWELRTACPVCSLDIKGDGTFLINGSLQTRQVVIATGGCSYPATGSDGSMFAILENLGLDVVPAKPALVPITVQQYPYKALSGISFQGVSVQIDGHQLTGDLLLTHNGFSGPAVLNLSRYAEPGSILKINYLPDVERVADSPGDRRKVSTFLADQYGLPKRFAEVIAARAGVELSVKASALTANQRRSISSLLTYDTFSVSGTGGFGSAMVTSGGVSLAEVDLKTFESKKYPGLFIIGEALNIDGDTGGYNLQFAFSSGYGAAGCVL